MSTLHRLETAIADAWSPPNWRDVTVVLAVSGGADSLAMALAVDALAQRHPGQGRLLLAHFNHGLREGADEDQRFVERFAAARRLRIELGRAAADLDGSEAAARDARYRFLTETAKRAGARYVATAHTADDQAETILYRVIRGTGLDGLAGIPIARSLDLGISLFRPLLSVRRHEVLDYLKQRDQPFCEDESNADLTYARNRIRRQLLPLLASYNERVVDSLLRLGTLAAETQQIIGADVEKLIDQCVNENAGSVMIDVRPLASEPPQLIRQLFIELWKQRAWPLRDMSQRKWQQLSELALGQPAAAVFPGGVRAEKSGDSLTLQRL